MRKLNKRINHIGRLIVDSLLLVLLFGILAIPASSVSLLHIKPTQLSSEQVLSTSDIREEEVSETTSSAPLIIEGNMDGMDLGQSGQ